MGRSFTPKYAVEYLVDRGTWTPAGWISRDRGKPSAENLARDVVRQEAATRVGGVNEHIGPTRILAAKIVGNRGERTLVAGYVRERNTVTIGWLLRNVTAESIPQATVAFDN